MQEVLDERRYKVGYVVRRIRYTGEDAHGGPELVMRSAFTTGGHYIGDPKTARYLVAKRGIKPELRTTTSNVCSIGFCEAEQKWYGWSHRALFGFGIGSTVKPGDCAYEPANQEDFIRECVRFWRHDENGDAEVVVEMLPEGVRVETKPNDDGKRLGVIHIEPWPDHYGRGEWTAQSLDDAKEMAMAFAESVS